VPLALRTLRWQRARREASFGSSRMGAVLALKTVATGPPERPGTDTARMGLGVVWDGLTRHDTGPVCLGCDPSTGSGDALLSPPWSRPRPDKNSAVGPVAVFRPIPKRCPSRHRRPKGPATRPCQRQTA
jgi:hypothetical protein